MKFIRVICSIIIILRLNAQDESVLPPLLTPPTPVEIPLIPFIEIKPPRNPNVFTPTTPKGVKIIIDGIVKISPNDPNIFLAEGPIHLTTNNNEELFADRAVIDNVKKIYTFYDNITVFTGPIMHHGDRATYNIQNQTLDTSGLIVSYDPILFNSQTLHSAQDDSGQKYYEGSDVNITSDDTQNPNFWLRAKKATIFPNEKIILHDLTFLIGNTPFFWFPYINQSANPKLGYRFIPGARSNWGFFFLTSYGIMLGGDEKSSNSAETPWLLSIWHADIRSRRGLGFGVDLLDARIQDNDNLSGLKLYYNYDTNPFITRSGLPRNDINNNRWQAAFQYRKELKLQDTKADYALNFDLHALSDNNFLEDFDPGFYRNNAEPDNSIFLTRRSESSLFTGLFTPRLNDFYRNDSRTELSFDQIKHPILDSRFLHEGQTSISMIEEKISDPIRNSILEPLLTLPANDPSLPKLLGQVSRYERLLVNRIRELPSGDPRQESLRQKLTDPAFSRFHTYQELAHPFTYDNWLYLTPKIGAGYTRYMDIDGPVNNSDRTIFSTGLEASVKLKKDYGDIIIPRLGLNCIRHILQPYANYSYLSLDNLPTDFPTIDRLTFSTRPVPINPGRFNAIDDLQNWNLIRLGMRNRLLTKRNDATHEWLFVDTYIDSYLNDPELNRDFSNLYNDIFWNPLPWFSAYVSTQFPIINSGSGFNEAVTGFRFMPTPEIEFSISNNYLKNQEFLQDSNRIQFESYARLNDNWGISFLQQWEFEDNTLEFQRYNIHRNFDNWIIGAGFILRDNRIKNEYGFMIDFTLREFPSLSIPLKLDTF
jgi:LPS-assembly protein